MARITSKEIFQRMNYLYQIGTLMSTDNVHHNLASVLYSNLLINISKKTVNKLDIPIKRTICKKCRSIMIVGVTCLVRIKKKKVMETCMRCKARKKFETRRMEYVPWTQRIESLVEMVQFE